MKLNFTKSCLFFTYLILSCSLTFFAQTEFPKGEVIERVTVQSDSNQSYALYLPKSYTPEKQWAILYAFEPIARGKLPVTIFQEAAEKYGYIVVGSYDSRNGLDSQTLMKVLNGIWDDTHQKFSIDEKRVYATGFSGGSRVASIFAAISQGKVAGVIGSGAGFANILKPSPEIPFIYFNAIGFDDYNFYEIRALKKLLETAKVTHRVEKFDGAHQWLTKDLAENALSWMQLHAMKKGVLQKDEKFITEDFQKRLTNAENYLKEQKFLEAYQSFSDIAFDFASLCDVSEIEKRVENFKKSSDLKKALHEEEDQIGEQNRNTSFLLEMGKKLINQEERQTALYEIRLYIARLQKNADSKEDNSLRRIARRSLNAVYANAYENALFNYEPKKKYDLAIINFELANEIYPKSPRIAYDRARVYALSGQKKRALEYLEKAVSFGFKNWQEIDSEKGFEKIRQEEKFQQFLEQIKNNK